MNPNRPTQRRSTWRAFTVTELLVVISLIIVLVLIAVPSFSAMIASSETAMAESQLRAALRAARDAAIRSTGGSGAGDGAAVFFFEPGGKLRIVPCVKAGEINDWADPNSQNNDTVRREIFVPAPGFTPIVLPKYWMVRGFAPANSFTDVWYGQSYSDTTNYAPTERSWVFPETGFYDLTSATDGLHRSTFMVRFQGGTGTLVGAPSDPVLVLAPRPAADGRTAAPYSQYRADRDGVQDPLGFVRRVLSLPAANGGSDVKRRILGRLSGDMVMARPVAQVALYNETKLAAAFGARVDRDTDCIYQPPPSNSGSINYSGYIPRYITAGTALTMSNISRYLDGDSNGNGVVDALDRPDGKLFAIDRCTGLLREMEVQP